MNQQAKPKRREPNVCMRCGGRDVTVRHRDDVVDFKGLTLEVSGLAGTICNLCAFDWQTDGQEQDNLALLRAAFLIKRDEVRDREGLLTGEQIASVLDELELSKPMAASLFGGGPNAFSKYIAGDVLQSFAMDRLIRLTLAVGPQALTYLKLGKDAPLRKHAVGYFVAGGNLESFIAPPVDVKTPVQIVKASSTARQPSVVQ